MSEILDSLKYIAQSAQEQVEREYWRQEKLERQERERVMWREDHGVTPVERIEVHCESIFTQRNEGSTTSFYSCGICGASVQPMDRETHIEWHRRVS